MLPSPETIQDRAIGCILAGAIGDALGVPYEGKPGPVLCNPPPPWYISDDTQMTLATCEAISESGSVDPKTIADSFLSWFVANKIRGIGSSTLQAMKGLQAGGHWALVGAKGEKSAGNGAAMRIAPVAFLLDPAVPKDKSIIRDVCFITHRNDEAYIGATAIILAVRAAAFDAEFDPTSLLPKIIDGLSDSNTRDRIQTIMDEYLDPPEYVKKFSPSGYVADSVPLALLCVQSWGRMPTLELLKKVVGLGGDADTIASMVGQIIGAWRGTGSVPAEVIENLAEKEEVLEIAEEFGDLVGTALATG